jgi:predicted aminopeptidase
MKKRLKSMARPTPSQVAGTFSAALRRFKLSLGQLLGLIALAIVIASLISGCSPLYVMRAAYEEGKILWRREPIADYLGKPDLVPDTEEKLRIVLAVREYAKDVLKMNVGGSYSSYSYVDRPDLAYILTAAPRTELKPYTWWFLFVGRVPYKGYFSKEDAEAAAAEFQAQGYDTNIRTTAAFSTLGWFDDPLLSHLLRYDKVTLADVIFHELLHSTLYVKGAGAFNESLANFVGGRGAIEFFRDKFGEDSAEYRQAIRAWEEELEFSEFIGDCGNSLDELYRRDVPYEEKLRLRQELFQQFKEDWSRRIADRPRHRFRAFSQQQLNNAILINYLLYLKNLKLFESVYQTTDQNLVSVIESIRQAVEKGGDPFQRVQALIERHNTLS